MENYVLRLYEQGQTVKAHPNRVESIFAFRPKHTQKQLAAAEAAAGQTLPEPLRAFYRQTDGLDIEWAVTHPEQPNRLITGWADVPNLDSFMSRTVQTWQQGAYRDDVPWSDHTAPDEVTRFDTFHILDHLTYGDAVLVDLGAEPPTLFLYLHRKGLFPLRVELEAYFDLLTVTRGLYGWQWYLVADGPPPGAAHIPDDFHTHMAALFPNADIGAFDPPPAPKVSLFNTFLQEPEPVDYRALFGERVRMLKQASGFQKVSFKPNPGVSVGALRKVAATLEHELPADLLAFYYTMNGFRLKWTYRGPAADEPVYGSMNLLPLEDVFGVSHGIDVKDWDAALYEDVLWFAHDDPEVLPVLQALKRLELIEGMNWDVTIRFVDEALGYTLYLWHRGETAPLDSTFPDYLNASLQTMGVHGWHLLLLDDEALAAFNLERPDIDRLARILPAFDATPFST